MQNDDRGNRTKRVKVKIMLGDQKLWLYTLRSQMAKVRRYDCMKQ